MDEDQSSKWNTSIFKLKTIYILGLWMCSHRSEIPQKEIAWSLRSLWGNYIWKKSVWSVNVFKQYLGPHRCARRKWLLKGVAMEHLRQGRKSQNANPAVKAVNRFSFTQGAGSGPCTWGNIGTSPRELFLTLPISAYFIIALDLWRLCIFHSFLSEWKIFVLLIFYPYSYMIYWLEIISLGLMNRTYLDILNFSCMELLENIFGGFFSRRDSLCGRNSVHIAQGTVSFREF